MALEESLRIYFQVVHYQYIAFLHKNLPLSSHWEGNEQNITYDIPHHAMNGPIGSLLEKLCY